MAFPPDELLRWLDQAFPEHDWGDAEHLHGAFHDVALSPDGAAARTTTGADGHRRAVREVAILRSLEAAALSIAVPRPLSGVLGRTGRAGYLTTTAPGAPRPPGDWLTLSSTYSTLLDALAASPGDLDLPPPRQWCGGADFPTVVAQRLAPGLGVHAPAALEAVRALLDLPPPRRPGLVHGDFGAHNVLWQGDRAGALIDWDHACTGDSAMDLAPLVGAHGAQAVSSLATAEDVSRAMVHRATLPLQIAAAAELAGRGQLRDHAVRNFVTRLEAGTLHDPDGSAP